MKRNGTGGVDFLEGTRWDDEINGFGGDDHIFGDEGADQINGGTGTDSISYSHVIRGFGYNTTIVFGGAIDVDLQRTGAQHGGFAEGDVLTSIEDVGGSRFDDIIKGSSADNVLGGNLGDDVLEGRDGDDVL